MGDFKKSVAMKPERGRRYNLTPMAWSGEAEWGDWIYDPDHEINAQPPTSEPPSSPGWISVEDRLPKNPTGALIYRDEGVSEALFMNGIWEYFGEEVCPTHWMPLPEAPS